MKRCEGCGESRGERFLTPDGLCTVCFRPDPSAIRRVGQRLLSQYAKHGDEALKMNYGGIYREEHRFNTLCQTVACHAGHYFLGHLDELSEEEKRHEFVSYADPVRPRLAALVHKRTLSPAGYMNGATMMAQDLGFVDSYQLQDWANYNSTLWGGADGSLMFSSHQAFGKSAYDPLTLYDIGHWWLAVAERVEKETTARERDRRIEERVQIESERQLERLGHYE